MGNYLEEKAKKATVTLNWIRVAGNAVRVFALTMGLLVVAGSGTTAFGPSYAYKTYTQWYNYTKIYQSIRQSIPLCSTVLEPNLREWKNGSLEREREWERERERRGSMVLILSARENLNNHRLFNHRFVSLETPIENWNNNNGWRLLFWEKALLFSVVNLPFFNNLAPDPCVSIEWYVMVMTGVNQSLRYADCWKENNRNPELICDFPIVRVGWQ